MLFHYFVLLTCPLIGVSLGRRATFAAGPIASGDSSVVAASPAGAGDLVAAEKLEQAERRLKSSHGKYIRYNTPSPFDVVSLRVPCHSSSCAPLRSLLVVFIILVLSYSLYIPLRHITRSLLFLCFRLCSFLLHRISHLHLTFNIQFSFRSSSVLVFLFGAPTHAHLSSYCVSFVLLAPRSSTPVPSSAPFPQGRRALVGARPLLGICVLAAPTSSLLRTMMPC
jgi:hypothetical protein